MFRRPYYPEHGDCTLCTKCGDVIEFVRHKQWNGVEYEVLDEWWAHLTHPADGHDASTTYG